VLSFNAAPHHGGVLGRGGIAPRILELCTRCRRVVIELNETYILNCLKTYTHLMKRPRFCYLMWKIALPPGKEPPVPIG